MAQNLQDPVELLFCLGRRVQGYGLVEFSQQQLYHLATTPWPAAEVEGAYMHEKGAGLGSKR